MIGFTVIPSFAFSYSVVIKFKFPFSIQIHPFFSNKLRTRIFTHYLYSFLKLYLEEIHSYLTSSIEYKKINHQTIHKLRKFIIRNKNLSRDGGTRDGGTGPASQGLAIVQHTLHNDGVVGTEGQVPRPRV